MKIKKFIKPLNGDEKKEIELSQKIEVNTLAKEKDILESDLINKCVKCKSSQNVKLVSIKPRFKGDSQKQFFLCEDCRKISLKVSILR